MLSLSAHVWLDQGKTSRQASGIKNDSMSLLERNTPSSFSSSIHKDIFCYSGHENDWREAPQVADRWSLATCQREINGTPPAVPGSEERCMSDSAVSSLAPAKITESHLSGLVHTAEHLVLPKKKKPFKTAKGMPTSCEAMLLCYSFKTSRRKKMF